MTYLTQILLARETAANLRFPDSYAWHKAVWKIFSGRDGKQRDFLTRLDRRRDGIRLLVVSDSVPSRPDWCQAECWQLQEIPESYFNASVYRFQLRANPTKKLRVGDKSDGTRRKQGHRVPLRKREDIIEWLNRKAKAAGFAVDPNSLRVIPRGRSFFVAKKGGQGVHDAVDFQGVLRVIDRDKFRSKFREGIGSAKAFGFGMLVMNPVPERGDRKNDPTC